MYKWKDNFNMYTIKLFFLTTSTIFIAFSMVVHIFNGRERHQAAFSRPYLRYLLVLFLSQLQSWRDIPKR